MPQTDSHVLATLFGVVGHGPTRPGDEMSRGREEAKCIDILGG